MIPILYENTEMSFASNGICRLRDCISCLVTEERNGIYEVDFEYPVSGNHFDEIRLGRIIGVTHDESGDVQPFDIVSYTREINGIVAFHGVHISYRLNGLVAYGTNINSLASALTMLAGATPSNPFTFETDMTSSAYMASADGVPRSVRELIGGVEGSILDTYGGELLWDKFTVNLLRSRGESKPVTVRYGLNLTEYSEEMDYSGSYTSAVPYWVGQNAKGKDTIVRGSRIDSPYPSYNGVNQCVALDLTEKFETIPTATQLRNEALSMMKSSQSQLPAQSLEIKYIDLKEFGEYETIANLTRCKLCDSIRVEYPRYNLSGSFKIVRVVYNVLRDRFDELGLGTPSTSLSEALGIQQGDPLKEYSYLTADDIYPLFALSTETATLGTVAANSNKYGALDVSKSGYYPLGIVGYQSSGTNVSGINVYNMYLSDRAVGSCVLYYGLRNVLSSSSITNGVLGFRVLWISVG